MKMKEFGPLGARSWHPLGSANGIFPISSSLSEKRRSFTPLRWKERSITNLPLILSTHFNKFSLNIFMAFQKRLLIIQITKPVLAFLDVMLPKAILSGCGLYIFHCGTLRVQLQSFALPLIISLRGKQSYFHEHLGKVLPVSILKRFQSKIDRWIHYYMRERKNIRFVSTLLIYWPNMHRVKHIIMINDFYEWTWNKKMYLRVKHQC